MITGFLLLLAVRTIPLNTCAKISMRRACLDVKMTGLSLPLIYIYPLKYLFYDLYFIGCGHIFTFWLILTSLECSET